MGQPPTWGYFDRLYQIKNTHQEFIYSRSIYCFCLDTVKDRIMLHKNNLSSHFASTAVILVWLQQDKSNVQWAFDSLVLKNYKKSLTYLRQLQYTSKGFSTDKLPNTRENTVFWKWICSNHSTLCLAGKNQRVSFVYCWCPESSRQ